MSDAGLRERCEQLLDAIINASMNDMTFAGQAKMIEAFLTLELAAQRHNHDLDKQLAYEAGLAARERRWTKVLPINAKDYNYYLWRPDPTARPYVLMFHSSGWRHGSEHWITPTGGEWSDQPIDLPVDAPPKEGAP